MSSLHNRLINGFSRRWRHFWQNAGLSRASRNLVNLEKPRTREKPVVFFNASTRLSGMSLNAGFSLLASWSLRMQGVPVVYFACREGMLRCVLGTNRDRTDQPPPCRECVLQSQKAYDGADVRWFSHEPDPALSCILDELPVQDMTKLEYRGIPVGRLVLPSLRWILRRHHLHDDEKTRYLYRQYILSAWGIAQQFERLLDDVQPQAVVVFNGMFFPEATARWVARQRKPAVRVIAHEVGLRPFSGFFTTGEATAYPIDIPDSFELNEEQSGRLDEYLSQRFKGNFSMAGIRFWPQMQPISAEFWEKARNFEQIVPVFTNVIFDTSQDHANVLFEDMFAWLDEIKNVMQAHPDTLFVLRAHPDETRPGKTSLESVADWVASRKIEQMPNVYFVPSDRYFSSYELIERSKFVLIYNSTIGLEASLLGAAVLCAGKARFTQLPTVFFPATKNAYLEMLEQFLLSEKIEIPAEHRHHARRFLYYQVFRTSLPFDRFLTEDGVWKGYVALKPFDPQELTPDHSETMRVISDGILRDAQFLLDV